MSKLYEVDPGTAWQEPQTQTSSSLSGAAVENGHGKLILQGQWKQDHLLVTAGDLEGSMGHSKIFRYTLKPLVL